MCSNYTLYVFSILFIFIHEACSQSCIFTWENGTELTEGLSAQGVSLTEILDTEIPPKTLLVLNSQNVVELSDYTTISDSMQFFIIPSFQNNQLRVTLSDEFIDYEQYETREVIRITVTFKCKFGSREFEIFQPVVDTNNHDPVLINTPYIYKLPMPLPKNISLNLWGAAISARDIDITNKKITFFLNSSEPNTQGFQAAWSSVDNDDKKVHHASLITTAVINLRDNLTFNIYAKDDAENPRTSKSTVSIIIDKVNSAIKFARQVYVADYTDINIDDANGTVFSFKEGNVSLVNGVDDNVEYSLIENSGYYQNNFNLNISPDKSKVQIILINPPEILFNESFVLLTLIARKDGTEETAVLHISLPGKATVFPTSTTPTSTTTISTTPVSSTSGSLDPNKDEELCYCTDCTTAIIVLSVFLVALTTGLVISIVLNWRRARLIPKVAVKMNGFPEKTEEMSEVVRDSKDTNSFGTHRRSVAFNDIVEEIKIARL